MTGSAWVYIMASRRNGTLYAGVTTNLVARCFQHRSGLVDGFTRTHGCTHLVWFEAHDALESARLREVQIKRWKRVWKLRLIEETNPQWCDLYPEIVH